jgi:hypothetical protein
MKAPSIAILFFIAFGLLPAGAEEFRPQPNSVLGDWGAFDQASGRCTPDGSGGEVTQATLYVEVGGHGYRFRLTGFPKCEGDRCTVTTHARGLGRIWTWTFKQPDVATVKGWMPHSMIATRDKHFLFEYRYKRGCQ